jgi:mannose-6-phosphate isomerase
MVPVLVETIWGGRRLGTLLHKDLPPDAAIGESWEVSDHPGSESRVANGPLRGRVLHEACLAWGGDLLDGPPGVGRFPLLAKFIDASEDLSVQVHPSDADCRAFDPGSRGKDEMWLVLAAGPGARIVHGVRAGIDPETLRRKAEAGEVLDCLHRRRVAAGDVIHNPPGTVHALGAGIVVAEIQQRSDATYRLYDHGRGRPLHIKKALQVARCAPGPDLPPPAAGAAPPGVERELLVRTPHYTVTRDRVRDGATWRPAAFEILCLLEGTGRFAWEGGELDVRAGDSVVVPALGSPLRFETGGGGCFVRATR